MTSRVVDLPPFRFFEQRAGSGTPVVLIHGLGGSSDWWRYNVEAIAREHLVVTVDLAGRALLPASIGEKATVLARWIESSFIEPIHLVGNSMGGHLAIHVVSQRPDLVRSLTLVNSTGVPFELAPGAHVANLIIPRGALSFGRVLARDAFRTGPTKIAVAFARLLRDDARTLMTGLRVPALVVWGESDPLVPLKYGQQIAETIPNARLVTIPNAGHIPMWENAEAFNRTLLEFLREVDEKWTTDNPVCRGEDRQDCLSSTFSWSIAGWTDGIAHRQSSRRADIVLVHGLGMSSLYFDHFARALHERGWHPIAPDLPGFGHSVDGPSLGAAEHAGILAKWADAIGIREAVWVGHSLSCDDIAHLAKLRPDLCRAAVMIGPLWSAARHPKIRLLGCLALDAFREPLRLFAYVIPAYWRCGLGRWFATFRRYDLGGEPPEGLMIAGERDPLPDRNRVQATEVEGAHACHFSHPESVVSALSRLRERVA